MSGPSGRRRIAHLAFFETRNQESIQKAREKADGAIASLKRTGFGKSRLCVFRRTTHPLVADCKLVGEWACWKCDKDAKHCDCRTSKDGTETAG